MPLLESAEGALYTSLGRSPREQSHTNTRGLHRLRKTLYSFVLSEGLFLHRELIYDRGMRGTDQQQSTMYSYVTLEQRIPADHPARQICVLVDRALARMDAEFDRLYATTGRPSIAPERLLRATLLMVLYSIRSERQLIEQIGYNLLFRWFVGLEMDDALWDATVFTKNRERLIAGAVSQQLLEAVLVEAREQNLLSEEHFTVDGTLIQAWAAARSFHDRSDPPAAGAGSGHKGEVLLRDKVESKTDPEARLFKKATADKSVPSYQGHALTENRNGLVVAAEATQSGTLAERTAAERCWIASHQTPRKHRRSRWVPTRSIRTRSSSRSCAGARLRRTSASTPRVPAWARTA